MGPGRSAWNSRMDQASPSTSSSTRTTSTASLAPRADPPPGGRSTSHPDEQCGAGLGEDEARRPGARWWPRRPSGPRCRRSACLVGSTRGEEAGEVEAAGPTAGGEMAHVRRERCKRTATDRSIGGDSAETFGSYGGVRGRHRTADRLRDPLVRSPSRRGGRRRGGAGLPHADRDRARWPSPPRAGRRAPRGQRMGAGHRGAGTPARRAAPLAGELGGPAVLGCVQRAGPASPTCARRRRALARVRRRRPAGCGRHPPRRARPSGRPPRRGSPPGPGAAACLTPCIAVAPTPLQR